MACEAEQQAFKEGLEDARLKLNNELAAVAGDTEAQAQQISTDLQSDNDLASGVGAAAGTAIGGIVAGPPGAAVGAVVGRQIGSLFTLEVQMIRHQVVLNVPQTTMRTNHVSFDVPKVTLSDQSFVVSTPTVEMRREPGPPTPRTTVRMVQRCLGPICTDVPETTIEWEPTWIDIPVTVWRDVRVVIGIPVVTMERQEISFDAPEITMGETTLAIDVPTLTLRFIKDAGRRTAAMAAALMQSAQEAVTKKQLEFRSRVQNEVTPLAHSMFSCFRDSLTKSRADAVAIYQPQIDMLTASVAALAARQVSEDAPEMKGARAALAQATLNRDGALASFDEALTKLNEAEQTAINGLLGSSNPLAGAFAVVDRRRSSVSMAISFENRG
jgi:hypothetical protein